jgi:iron complex outermembrane recepter protein
MKTVVMGPRIKNYSYVIHSKNILQKVGKPLSAALFAAALSVGFSSAAFAQAGEALALEEVLVTAQKRVQSLQEVPVSISVMDERFLEASRLEYSSDITLYTPNLSADVNNKQTFNTFYIRGIGATDNGMSSNPAVGFLVDGIFANASIGNVMSILDIEQIDVIRGPQGTMFGRNTIGGVINVVTKKPQDEFSAKIEAGVGNYSRRELNATATGPLLPGLLSGYLGAAYSETDGFVENEFPGRRDAEESENEVGRGALRWTPTDIFEVLLAADYGKTEGSNYGSQVDGTTVTGYTDTSDDIRKGAYDPDNGLESIMWGTSATLIWQLDAGEIKWLSGYRDSDARLDNVDQDGTPDSVFHQWLKSEETSFSSEVQFAFDLGERSSWVIGAYYLDFEGSFDTTFNIYGYLRPILPPGSIPVSRLAAEADSDTWSVFANMDFDLTDRLSLALGGRYSDTNKEYSVFQQLEFGPNDYVGDVAYDNIPDTVFVQPLSPVIPAEDEWSRFNPRLALTFQQSDSLMLYASAAQGHRDGGFTPGPLTAEDAVPYDMEILTAYEIGFKSTVLDGSTRFNAAVFFYDYDDIQVEEAIFGADQGIVSRVSNAGEAEAYGLEAELLMNVTSKLHLMANLGLLHSEYTQGTVDNNPAKGNRFARAPEVTWSFIPEYTLAAFNAGDIVLRGEWLYRSSEYQTVKNSSTHKSMSRHLINASVNFSSSDQHWQISLWGKNLTDEEYVVDNKSGVEELIGTTMSQYGDPLTAGVSVTYNFR